MITLYLQWTKLPGLRRNNINFTSSCIFIPNKFGSAVNYKIDLYLCKCSRVPFLLRNAVWLVWTSISSHKKTTHYTIKGSAFRCAVRHDVEEKIILNCRNCTSHLFKHLTLVCLYFYLQDWFTSKMQVILEIILPTEEKDNMYVLLLGYYNWQRLGRISLSKRRRCCFETQKVCLRTESTLALVFRSVRT